MEGKTSFNRGAQGLILCCPGEGSRNFCLRKRAEMQNGAIFETFWSILKHTWESAPVAPPESVRLLPISPDQLIFLRQLIEVGPMAHPSPTPPMRTLLSLLLTPSEKNRYVTFQDGFEEFSGGLMGRFSHTKFICEIEEKATFTVARFGVKSTAAYK